MKNKYIILLGIFLAFASVLKAQINYVDIPDGTPDGIDFNQDGNFEFTIDAFGMTNPGDYISYWDPGQENNNIHALGTPLPDGMGWDTPEFVDAGFPINSTCNWIGEGDCSHDGWGGGNASLEQGTDQYLAVRFSLDGTTTCYGWIRVNFTGTAFIYKDHAYICGNTSTINAGDVGGPPAETHIVSFNSNGGSGVMPAQVFTEGIPQNLSQSVFTNAGFVFAGWATSPTGQAVLGDQDLYSPLADITLYAVWEEAPPATYMVRFYSNGGSGDMTPQYFEENVPQALKQNTFVRDGYIFSGWATSASGAVVYVDQETITPTSNINLYAVWTEITSTIYTVNFNANGGNGFMNSQIFIEGEAQAINPNAFTRSGYEFMGWATSAVGVVVYINQAMVIIDEDLDLYAVWEEIPMLRVNLVTVDNACGQIGSAALTIISSCGGNPTVAWSSSSNTGLFEPNLGAGSYSVTVTDNDASCGDTVINYTIFGGNSFSMNIGSTGSTCDDEVQLTANVIGINPANATYDWNDPANSTTQSITVNSSGTYSCSVSYGNCSEVDEIEVSNMFSFNVDYDTAICVGGTINAAFELVSGVGPFLYEWSNGYISSSVVITEAGNYCLTATDLGTSCQNTFCFEVVQSPDLQVEISSDNISCFGENDGEATAVIAGGVPEYTYAWSTLATTETISQLYPGNYSVTVTDANGCTGEDNVFIEEPPLFYYTITENHGICFGDTTTIEVTTFGGVAPYSYSWYDEETLNVGIREEAPLQTKTYTVTATDANGCSNTPKSCVVTVSQPITYNIQKVDVLCHGLCTGGAIIGSINGGTAPFLYSWDGFNVAPEINQIHDLCAGEYTVSVTDLFGCGAKQVF